MIIVSFIKGSLASTCPVDGIVTKNQDCNIAWFVVDGNGNPYLGTEDCNMMLWDPNYNLDYNMPAKFWKEGYFYSESDANFDTTGIYIDYIKCVNTGKNDVNKLAMRAWQVEDVNIQQQAREAQPNQSRMYYSLSNQL